MHQPEVAYTVTYAPSLKANGVAVTPNTSRQQLRERHTEIVHAATAGEAVSVFESRTDRMVTACEAA